MGQHQHPRFALIASAVLFVAGCVAWTFSDDAEMGPAALGLFLWFLAFAYFLIWVVYRRYKPRPQPPGFDVIVKPPSDKSPAEPGSSRR